MLDMAEWTRLALLKTPRAACASRATCRGFVCTDASRFGWGYVALNRITGEFRSYGARWTKEQLSRIFSRKNVYKVKRSVYSEPLALYNSLCAAC